MSAFVGWVKALLSPASSRPSSSPLHPKKEPLFRGYLACFSPSVDQALRVLWVKNGGTLTHTPEDFKKARFFFWTGMDDPWLKELRSRSLIVRHASWVTLCVAEKFLMPVAHYTLDDGFQESKIRVIDPSTLVCDDRLRLAEKHRDQKVLGRQSPPVEKASRKRRISDESESYRPQKRARIDEQQSPKGAEEVFRSRKAAAIRNRRVEVQDGKGLDCAPRRISFAGRKSISAGKVSRTAKIFESRIRLSNAAPPLACDEPTGIAQSPLNPHTLFWNDLLTKSYTKEAKTLTLSVKDLFLAPETKAVIFDVNKTYLGRQFINMDYA